ncbi:MAG: hypothetical protein QW203_07125 [Thermoplasmatales archaeon]
MRGIYTYQITLSNTTSTPTPPNLQVRLNINFASLVSNINADLGNIRFSSDQAGNNLLYAWLESAPQGTFTQGSSVSAYTSSNVWVNLGNNIIPANGSLNIYMQILSNDTEFDGVYWGANPLWTSTYGQYDNGTKVFNFYNNWAGTTLSPLISAPAGVTVTQNNGLQINITSTSSVHYIIINQFESSPFIFQSLVTAQNAGNSNNFQEGLVIDNSIPSGQDADGTEYSFRLINYGGGAITLQEGGNVLASESVPISTPYTSLETFEQSPTGISMTDDGYSFSTSTTALSSGYIGFYTYSSTTGNALFIQYSLTRTYPPNGIDPVLTSIQILFVGNYTSASTPVPAWSVLSGKPYITVSPKGISNGLSNIPNDGADFGPDTLLGASSPNQYGPPYTQTSGIQEAFTALESTGGYIQFGEGCYYLNTTATYTSEHALKIRGIRPNIARGFPFVPNGTIFMPGPDWNEPSGTPMLMFLNATNSNDGYLDFDGAGFLGVYLQPGDTVPISAPAQGVAAFQCGNTTVNEGNGPVAKSITNMKIVDCSPAWISYSGGGPSFYDRLHITGSGSAELYDYSIHMGKIEVWSPSGNYVFHIHDGAGGTPPTVLVDQIYAQLNAILSLFGFDTTRTNGTMLSIGKINLLQGISATSALFSQNGTGSVVVQVGNIYQWGAVIVQQYNSTNTPLINITIDSLYSTKYAQIVGTGGYSYANGSSLIINNFYADSLASGYTFTNFMIGNLLTIVKKYLPAPSPTLSANPPVSGTVYQNLNVYDIRIYLPAYATTSGTAGSVTIALGSSSTPSTIGTKYINGSTSSSATEIIELVVPAGWYYEFTATGVTFGTATVMAI